MKKIYIFDTTLRDGEQTAGVSLNPRDKLKIAKQLEKLNVDVIEVGFPASNEEDYLAAEMIAKEVRKPTICAFGRAMKEDIEKAYESIKFADKKRIHTFLATSKIHLDKKLKKKESKVLEMIYEGVSYARSFGVEVEFSAEDASRTSFPFMIKSLETAVQAGATILNIPDTVGSAQPFQFYERVKKTCEHFKKDLDSGELRLSVHCHNDKGQAVANSLMGVLAGATQVEGCINGIGERTGNASIEEVAMNIFSDKEYFKAYTEVNTQEIYKTSKLVSDLTQIPISCLKPLVGKNAFSHESGIHQHGVLSAPQTYEVFDPKDVGWTGERFVVGKHSGKHIQEYLKTRNNLKVQQQT